MLAPAIEGKPASRMVYLLGTASGSRAILKISSGPPRTEGFFYSDISNSDLREPNRRVTIEFMDAIASDRDQSRLLPKIHQKIKGMVRRRGWDGMGAKAIRESHCAAAITFLEKAYNAGLPTPDAISPSALGAISFQWDKGDKSVYARVHSDGPDGCVYWLIEGARAREGRDGFDAVVERLARFYRAG